MPTTVIDRTPRPTSTTGCTCPECGGLECLCRPRFFAGQLLTEEELNRLDHYIVAKNRLQNRYLHGWGVVCGLDVVCDDCSNGVIVKPGYALSPCGDDIIVCNDAAVNVCDLVQRCVKKTRPRCEELVNSFSRVPDDCVETGDWVLAIRYAEHSSRGVTPLRGGGCACGTASSSCGCGGGSGGGGCTCGCGGGCSGDVGGGGCGCGGGSAASSRTKTSAGGCGCGCSGTKGSATKTSRFSSAARCAPPLECEPTVICEGFCFEVYRLPPQPRTPPTGPMATRFAQCLADITAVIPPFPSGNNRQEAHDWCCQVRDGLLDYLSTHSIYDCSLSRRVQAILCPDVQLSDAAFSQALANATNEIKKILMALLISCLCSALMPPCPEPVKDGLVPLAVVRLSGTGTACRVTSICNWTTQRKFATTFPNIQYWLSILPFGRMLRESMERLCCRILPPLRRVSTDRSRTAGFAAPTAPGPGAADAADSRAAAAADIGARDAIDETPPINESTPTPADLFRASEPVAASGRRFADQVFEAFRSQDRSESGETLLRSVFGESPDEGGLAPEKFPDLLSFLALDQMAKPAFRSTLGDKGGLASAIDMMAAFGAARSPYADESASLSDEVASLRDTVERQRRDIEELRARMDNG